MKKTFLKLSFAVVVLLSVSSCKKSNNSKSRTELLTQKAWIISNSEIGSGENWATEEEFASWETCQKDDAIIFKTDKTIEVNQGASKCEEDEPQTLNEGSWDFADDETKLTLFGDTGTIDQLDENTLIVRGIEPENQNINYRWTFKH